MTIRDKVSMFLETLLREIEQIDNNEIQEVALKGLETQLKFHIQEIRELQESYELKQLATKEINNG